MCPLGDWLVRCPHCAAFLWLDEQECLGECWIHELKNPGESPDDFIEEEDYEVDPDEIDPELKKDPKLRNAVPFEKPSAHEIFYVLEKGGLSEAKVRHLRRILWWSVNDVRRMAFEIDHDYREIEFSGRQLENLKLLFEMLDPTDADDRIMMAEIKRELGEFEQAKELLEGPFPKRLTFAVSTIKDLIDRKDRFVAPIIVPPGVEREWDDEDDDEEVMYDVFEDDEDCTAKA